MSAIAEQITEGIKTGFESLRASIGGTATLQARVTDLEGQITAAQGTITELKGKLTAKDEEITKLKADHAAALEAKETDVEKRAGLKAAEIVASKGMTAGVKDEAKGAQGSNGGEAKTKLEQFQAIDDPKESAKFFAAHEADILAGK
jgi:uncharacterized coiled-coil protein SlyX